MSSQDIREIGNGLVVCQSAAELDSFNRELSGMIENSYDALCIADGESRIVLLNRAFEEVMGFPIKDMIGQKIIDIVTAGLTDTAATVEVLRSGRQSTVTIHTSAGRKALSTGVPVYNAERKVERIFCNLRNVEDLLGVEDLAAPSDRAVSRHVHSLQGQILVDHLRARLITRNENMKRLLELVYRLSQVDSSLLILGESGVGKDLLARIVHETSPRAKTGTFVTVNCGAIPEALMESELFGYEPGAFTGARARGKAGYFEAAEGGTLFLNEIAEVPLPLQVKLLSVIETRQITRVGGTTPKETDVRIMAATNCDLEKMVAEKRFREDLYYRINVVPIKIPPLRDRLDDIPFLITHFASLFGNKYSTRKAFHSEVLKALARYRWPGNVRELMNLVERLLVTIKEPLITLDHLPPNYLAPPRNFFENHDEVPQLKAAVEEFESKVITWALGRCGSREQTAHTLGISLSTLNRKIRQGPNQF